MIKSVICLPNDLQEYVRKKTGRRVAKCVAFEAAVILFLLVLGNRVFSALGVILQSLVYVILLMLPFLLTGVPLAFIWDRNWSGTVTDVKVKTKTAYTTDYQYLQNIIILTMVNADGKTFKKTVAVHNVQTSKGSVLVSYSEAKVEHYMNDYQIGDEVYHFSGLPYPLVIGPNYKERTTCVVCGQETKSDQSRCWNCDHSLIKLK